MTQRSIERAALHEMEMQWACRSFERAMEMSARTRWRDGKIHGAVGGSPDVGGEIGQVTSQRKPNHVDSTGGLVG